MADVLWYGLQYRKARFEMRQSQGFFDQTSRDLARLCLVVTAET